MQSKHQYALADWIRSLVFIAMMIFLWFVITGTEITVRIAIIVAMAALLGVSIYAIYESIAKKKSIVLGVADAATTVVLALVIYSILTGQDILVLILAMVLIVTMAVSTIMHARGIPEEL